MTRIYADTAAGQDRAAVIPGLRHEDHGKAKGAWFIDKWEFPDEIRQQAEAELRAGLSLIDAKRKYGDYYQGSVFAGYNLLLNEGINALWTLVAGGSETAYNNANAELGVGDSTTAAAATQTDLQAATNKLFKAMDASYPTYGTLQKITFRSTFASGDANFAWQEFSVRNGNSANKNLNRLVSAQGTKTSGQSWQLTLEITLS
jgi:hypothetical protein